ncbi:nucleotide exchange factor GrpE [Patescibacteria group bacterium]
MNDEEEIIEEDAEYIMELKKIKDKLKKCAKEKEEYLAGWQRAKADFINARKAEQKSREEFSKYAEAQLFYEILDITDSFEEALKIGTDDGIKMLYNQIKGFLKNHNVEEIELSEGDEFNPEFHEAIKGEGNIVESILQKGYKIHERVLRPVRVIVKK